MIILDLQQVMLATLLVSLDKHTNAALNEDLLRHMILNSIRANKMKFYDKFGELVIACDSPNSWRKKIFPYYKANRKASRNKIDLDWKTVFNSLNSVREELRDNFPYRVIMVDTAEADDIIATIVTNTDDDVIILSSDKDFIQLHRTGVVQYNPVLKKYIKHDDPSAFLKEHILKGDTSDGIPNVLSEDNCFVIGERQRPLTAKKIERMLSSKDLENELPLNIQRNYFRNKNLIDLNMIPSDIKASILVQYEDQKGKGRGKIMNYLMKHRLKELMENLSDF